MFCQNCGNNVKDNEIYCPYCGSKVERGEGAPEVKPVNPDKPVNEMKWVQPVMITLFILTLLIWFLGFIGYVIIVGLTIKDPLDLSEYFKLYLPIIALVISTLCLSLGIFFKAKKYQTVKNIVIGIIGTISAIVSVVLIGVVTRELNKAPKLSVTSEYYLDMKVMEPLIPTKFESKVFMTDVKDADGNIESVPAYIYLKFTNQVEITIFETEIANSQRWKQAEIKQASLVKYDYYLIYNYETHEFNSSDLEHSLIVYYSKEHKSMAVIPGTIISYIESKVPQTA